MDRRVKRLRIRIHFVEIQLLIEGGGADSNPIRFGIREKKSATQHYSRQLSTVPANHRAGKGQKGGLKDKVYKDMVYICSAAEFKYIFLQNG